VPRTAPPAPLTDQRLWRRLLARLHPDAGGTEELFVFGQAVRERVEAGDLPTVHDVGEKAPARSPAQRRRRARPKAGQDRRPIAFEAARGVPFEELTRRAVDLAGELEEPYRFLFSLLEGCQAPDAQGPAHLVEEATTGACYRRMAKVGRLLDLDGAGRMRLYRLAQGVPLSDLHARHWLRRVDDEGARP
jgi:hypothetical protein